MPIQRQSEQYGAFDSGPRWERDRESHDLPKGLAGLMNATGRSIQSGLLNTRQAVNTDGMHPDSHAYHTELPPGRGGEVTWVDDAESYGRNPRREYNPDFGYEPTDEDERRQEGVAEDDDSGYNWGPDPRHASRHPFDRTAACESCGVDVYHISGTGWVHADDDDHDGEAHDEDHQAEPDHDDDLGLGLSSMNAEHEKRELQGRRTGDMRLAKDGKCNCWEGYERVPGTEPCSEDSCRKESMRLAGMGVDERDVRPGPLVDSPLYDHDPEDAFGRRPHGGPHCEDCGRPTRWVSGPKCRHGKLLPNFRFAAGEMLVDPSQMQIPQGGGYQIGHRVGVDYHQKVIPGTVIGLDGPSVKVRWDDKQYTTEEPRNIRLL